MSINQIGQKHIEINPVKTLDEDDASNSAQNSQSNTKERLWSVYEISVKSLECIVILDALMPSNRIIEGVKLGIKGDKIIKKGLALYRGIFVDEKNLLSRIDSCAYPIFYFIRLTPFSYVGYVTYLETALDLTKNVYNTLNSLHENKHREAAEYAVDAVKNSLYLGVMLKISLEWNVAYFLLNAGINFYKAQRDWENLNVNKNFKVIDRLECLRKTLLGIVALQVSKAFIESIDKKKREENI